MTFWSQIYFFWLYYCCPRFYLLTWTISKVVWGCHGSSSLFKVFRNLNFMRCCSMNQPLWLNRYLKLHLYANESIWCFSPIPFQAQIFSKIYPPSLTLRTSANRWMLLLGRHCHYTNRRRQSNAFLANIRATRAIYLYNFVYGMRSYQGDLVTSWISHQSCICISCASRTSYLKIGVSFCYVVLVVCTIVLLFPRNLMS